jgi:COP9 signalosome complex subunit 1
MSLSDLEKQLVELICENKISARIDSHNKILHARFTDERISTFEHSLQVGDKYVYEMTSLLLRMSLMENEITVKNLNEEHSMKASIQQIFHGKQ